MFSHFIKYFNYYVRAKTIYDVHSPYVYALIEFVFDKERLYYAFQSIPIVMNQYVDAVNQDRHLLEYLSTLERDKAETLYRTLLFLNPDHIYYLGTLPTYLEDLIAGLNSSRPLVNVSDSSLEMNFTHLVDDLTSTDVKRRLLLVDAEQLLHQTFDLNRIISAYSITQLILFNKEKIASNYLFCYHLKSNPAFNIWIDNYYTGIAVFNTNIEKQIDISYISYYKKFWRAGFF